MWSKSTLSAVVVALCAMILAGGTGARTIYVDDDAPPGGDGSSWATAYRFLQDGLTAATDGDEVRVGQGQYKPDRSAIWPEGDGDREASFVVPQGVILKGGYAGLGAAEPNAWDADLCETILSGDLAGDDVAIDDPSLFRDDASREDNSLNVVTAGPATILEGLVITAGHALPYKCTNRNNCPDVVPAVGFNGGGIWIVDDNVVVKNCRLHHNFADQGGGGVLCARADDIVLQQCTFDNNGAYAFSGGGALSLLRSSVAVESCLFLHNWARYEGGAIDTYRSDVAISACTIEGNRSDYDGGGLYLEEGTTQIMDCRITYNLCKGEGGGLQVSGSPAEIMGCMFIGNSSG